MGHLGTPIQLADGDLHRSSNLGSTDERGKSPRDRALARNPAPWSIAGAPPPSGRLRRAGIRPSLPKRRTPGARSAGEIRHAIATRASASTSARAPSTSHRGHGRSGEPPGGRGDGGNGKPRRDAAAGRAFRFHRQGNPGPTVATWRIPGLYIERTSLSVAPQPLAAGRFPTMKRRSVRRARN